MRHALIHKKARLIDRFIDDYKHVRERETFPHKEVAIIIRLLFPGSSLGGRGAFKTVHKISSRERDLALKTSNRRNIYRDMLAYNRLPRTRRNRYFAKIYWRTKYCLLQKFGKAGRVQPDRLAKLKKIAKRYGLTDVRPDNIRKVEGVFKIVDASVGRKRG